MGHLTKIVNDIVAAADNGTNSELVKERLKGAAPLPLFPCRLPDLATLYLTSLFFLLFFFLCDSIFRISKLRDCECASVKPQWLGLVGKFFL